MNAIKVGNTIINMDNVFAITLQEDSVIFKGSNDKQVNCKYIDHEKAKDIFDEIWRNLAE
jgi:hypothetical protein